MAGTVVRERTKMSISLIYSHFPFHLTATSWSGWYPPPGYDQLHKESPPKTLKGAVVSCDKPPAQPAQCTKELGPCLFDISTDPCEYVNQANKQPEILNNMLSWLEEYKKGMVPIKNKPYDLAGSPRNHGGVWVPWR